MIKAMYQFPWFLWTNRIEVGINKIRDFVENIRKEKERIFMQGYCWGGTVVLQLASEGIADGICCAHPGQVNLELTIKTPILFAFAESDIFLASDIAEKVDKNVKKNAKVLVKQYAGTIHGFAVRGNSADEVVRNQRKQVLQDAIEFFESLL
jgi:dienelactone hydrolase